MSDFEKLGAFYLGKRFDEPSDEMSEDLVLYDSKDLNTHAVIIGMTGSGKTGLGIGMIEEAAMDNIPVIAIDPKGDMGNLLLTFPDFKGDDFLPWVNHTEASNRGETPEQFAAGQAALWKKGIAGWGQKPKRVRDLKKRVDMNIYTPGSTAGLPVSVLRSFDAPDAALLEDRDLYRERVQVTATSILALLGINADPVTSREHILIANLLDHYWQEGRSIDLARLIAEIQSPPMKKIGVMELDTFYPAKDRMALAMKLNNLLAAPGFEAWMEGEPLNAASLLYTESGQPRVSVMSIAHLSDAERMFFVCMLLNQLIAWMRAQPGTSSLRAILYMDEIFGYMPPVANPPSKQLLLTLLKQARAYGLGLVLSTQNPVDLDYKGLSNTGTWMIGRLQTERDKARVMEGLEGATAGGEFDKQAMERTLAGLGKRRFLLHNVHESAPVVFGTRWVMSYLAGPMTRDQIKAVMASAKSKREKRIEKQKAAATLTAKNTKAVVADAVEQPSVPKAFRQFWLETNSADLVYRPALIGAAELFYSSARYKVEQANECIAYVIPEEGPVAIDWDDAAVLPLAVDELSIENEQEAATFAALPLALQNSKKLSSWEKAFKRWLRLQQTITLYRSDALKVTSTPDETEADFRIRLQTLGNEKRDLAVGKLRKKYESKVNTLEARLLRAEQAIERETEQASKKKLDTAISFGAAILGAVLGRKRISKTSAGKFGTAVKTMGGMRKESGDVDRAKETAAKVQSDLSALQKDFEASVADLDAAYDGQTDELSEITIKPKSTDIQIHFVGLLWVPYERDSKGRLSSLIPG
ncbi:MAG: ATP-binding protein [Woeseiaceae bacterium]